MFWFQQYPESFKAEVAEYARILGQRTTARLFSISQKQIFDWISRSNSPTAESIQTAHSDSGQSASKTEARSYADLSLRSKNQLLDLEIERDVYDWVQQQLPKVASSTEIRSKAKELYQAKGHASMKCSYGWYRRWMARFNITNSPHEDTDPLILTWLLQQYDDNHIVSYRNVQNYAEQTLSKIKPEFKASTGWATRFLKRHHLVINWDGICDHPLPDELENSIEAFRNRVRESIMPRYLTLSGPIGCMDEIPLSFLGSCNSEEICGNFSRNNASRVKKFSIRNCEATVLLTLMVDGSLLPPFVILKAQDANTINKVYSKPDSDVVIFYCQSTEPSLISLQKWFELIWTKTVSVSTPALLFLDSYNLHEKFKADSELHETSIELIPLGTSCKLQPINYLARRRFLKCMDDFWADHVRKGNSEVIVEPPSTDKIVEWVTTSYVTVREQKVLLSDSFQKVNLLPSSAT